MIETLDIGTEHCKVEKEDKFLIVSLNRPEAKNALTAQMLLGMYRAWRRLDEDDGLMCDTPPTNTTSEGCRRAAGVDCG